MPYIWTKVFEDQFNNSVVDLSAYLGNGSINETTSYLQEVFTAVNAEWEPNSGLYNAPGAYEDNISTYFSGSSNLYMVEGRLLYNSNQSITFQGISVGLDLDNSLDITYSWNNASVVCHEVVGGGNRNQIAAPLSMGGTPYWFRIYWNKSTLAQITQEGHAINSNMYKMYWSRDGINFTDIYLGTANGRPLPFTPTRIGIFNRAIGTGTSTARFDYLELWEYAAEPPNLNVPYNFESSLRQYHHPYPLSDNQVQGNFDGASDDIAYEINRGLELGTSPYIINRSPTPNAYPVDHNTLIRMDIVDDETNILPETIRVYINDSLAYDGNNDSFLSPYNGLDSYTSNVSLGKHITLDYTGTFNSYEKIMLNVQAQNDLGNLLDTSYSFITDSNESVEFANISPGENLENVDKNAVISVNLYDKGIGVNPYSIDAYIEDQLVFEGSTQTFYYPYNGAQSGLVYELVDGYDGYKLRIDRVSPYPSYKTVGIRIIGHEQRG